MPSRPLWLVNNCPHPIRFYIRWMDPVKGGWIVGPWTFASSTGPTRLVYDTDNKPVRHVEGEKLYLYGETTDSSGQYWQGANNYTLSGVTYNMMSPPLTVQDGHFLVNLTCPSATKTSPPPSTSGSHQMPN